MFRILLGSVFTFFFGVLLLASVAETIDSMTQHHPYTAHLFRTGVFLFFTIIGLTAIWQGRKKRKTIRRIRELTLKKQSESGYVNAAEVSEETNATTTAVLKIVGKMEKAGLVKVTTQVDAARNEGVQAANNSNAQVQSQQVAEEKKKQLKCLLDEDLITKEEYEKKCKELSMMNS